MSYYFGQHYLEGKQLKSIVTQAKKLLKEADFDTIAVRGNSGMLIGAPLALAMGKRLMIVRKKGESSHGNEVEGWGKKQKILILDDFISTGATLIEIERAIRARCDTPKIIGIFLYATIKHSTKSANSTYTLRSRKKCPLYKIEGVNTPPTKRYKPIKPKLPGNGLSLARS